MKIFVDKHPELVQNAYAELTEAGLELVINTRDHYAGFHRRGGFAGNLDHYGFPVNADHQTVEIYGPNDDDNVMSRVVFVAETPEEGKRLNGNFYQLQDGFQIIILVMDAAKFTHINTLGWWERPQL